MDQESKIEQLLTSFYKVVPQFVNAFSWFISPISLGFIEVISILTMVYKPTLTKLGDWQQLSTLGLLGGSHGEDKSHGDRVSQSPTIGTINGAPPVM